MVLAAVLLSGCAATASQTYSPYDSPDKVWEVSGHQAPFGKMTIRINGQPAMDGQVSIWTGSGQLAGSYDGRPARANCTKQPGTRARTSCQVFVGDEAVGTLHFRI
jgi:hypothetical protein